jgi:sugar transferase (PEP-CTERM/EpsH1 system associated)
MHLVYTLRPGGMELGVVKVVNGLDPARVQCSVCSTRPAGDLKRSLAPHVRFFELHGRNGNDLKLVWDLYRLFRRERPHVVHTHAWGTLLEGLVAARLARVPVVIHGEHGTLQLRPYQRWLQRLGWSAADDVLSVSSRLADKIASETGFSRAAIRVLPNGVDLSRFDRIDRAATRAALGLSADARVAVTVGRLVPVKDQRTLLEALALLHRDQVPATLLVAGDGPLRESLEAQAVTLGIAPQVRFLGHRPDVEQILGAADVFVLSSASEGMSNTILEAMACRLPVVATHVGGADEMVIDGETGYLVPPGAPRPLADALAPLLTDAGRARTMGVAGRLRAEQEFSLSGMLRRYESLYLEATAMNGATGVSATPVGHAAGRSKVS